ncbi:translesion DNA synthesis-associated protein ImuA [uncultured Ramlibacter sp.]|uniref:translesion DNA synthesis-associated protein ImuA n=1 Tax=uncultured Ramlibacter sp. TaxID=260755 RepID=UPI002619CA1C|nr:translesion DNA synthesis-associated protein ImuA [uncultured Ramlibacter sp.]
MSTASRLCLAAMPASLSSQVWGGAELGAAPELVLPSGFAALDAALPGGGWPLGSLVEVLQAQPEQHVWQLLLPALAQAVQDVKAGPVVLVGAPLQPFGPSLAAQGLPSQRLLCVHADKPAARLWAAEQALRCAEVAAVLAWLPQALGPQLRRLHLAAQQQGRLLVVVRALGAAAESSPARLRLRLDSVQDQMRVHILKRRGPPQEAAVLLPARAQRLTALLAPRKPGAAAAASFSPRQTADRSHALDRTPARV